jgi:hypothetical protein
MSSTDSLQSLCETGQQHLIAMEYWQAEKALERAEKLALDAKDFDTLGRLYMPLQEARRQRRQCCGEGIVCLDLVSNGPSDRLDGRHVVENFPHGQLLVAGWGTIEPALKVRQLAVEYELYVETFLAAAYPVGDGRAIVIAPLSDVKMPDASPRSIDALMKLLPAHCIVLSERELARGSRKGNSTTFAEVMATWERLHALLLAAADMQVDPMQKIEGYRKTIRADYACELAHQKLSDAARQLIRNHR